MARETINAPSVEETARRQFEEAWRGRQPQPIEHFLPPEDHPRYLATLEELVHIELEFAWKFREPLVAETANPVRQPSLVEAYLARFPQLNQAPILLRLLAQECLVRHLWGAPPAPEEYHARFPEVLETDRQIEDLLSRSLLPERAARNASKTCTHATACSSREIKAFCWTVSVRV